MGGLYQSGRKRRQRLFRQQEAKCWYCGKVTPYKLLEFEHQHPRSKGGGNGSTNIVLACVPCNREKSNMGVEEYRKFLSFRDNRYVIFHGESEIVEVMK